MMSISTHDRISGIPGRVKLLEEFIKYAQKQKGVVFMRKDEIAKWALSASNVPRETRCNPSTSSYRNVMLSQSFVLSLSLIAVFTGAGLASAGENLPAPHNIVVAGGQEQAAQQIILD